MIMTTTAVVDCSETFASWESSTAMETSNTHPGTLDATVGESIASTLTASSGASSSASSATASLPARADVLSMRAGFERQDSEGVWSSSTQVMSNTTMSVSTRQRRPSRQKQGLNFCSGPPSIPRRRGTLEKNQQLFLMMEMFSKFQSDQSLASLIELEGPEDDLQLTYGEVHVAPEQPKTPNRGYLREPNDPFPPMMPNRLESDHVINSQDSQHDQANLPPFKPHRQDSTDVSLLGSTDVSLLGFEEDVIRPPRTLSNTVRLGGGHAVAKPLRYSVPGGVSKPPTMPYRQDSIQSSVGDLSLLTGPSTTTASLTSLGDYSSQSPSHYATSQVVVASKLPMGRMSSKTLSKDTDNGSTSGKLDSSTPTTRCGGHIAFTGTRSCPPKKPSRRESLQGIREDGPANFALLLLGKDNADLTSLQDDDNVIPLSSSCPTSCNVQPLLSLEKGGEEDHDDDHPEDPPPAHDSVNSAETTRPLGVTLTRRSYVTDTA